MFSSCVDGLVWWSNNMGYTNAAFVYLSCQNIYCLECVKYAACVCFCEEVSASRSDLRSVTPPTWDWTLTQNYTRTVLRNIRTSIYIIPIHTFLLGLSLEQAFRTGAQSHLLVSLCSSEQASSDMTPASPLHTLITWFIFRTDLRVFFNLTISLYCAPNPIWLCEDSDEGCMGNL